MTGDPWRALFALIVVVGLILLVAWLMRSLSSSASWQRGRAGRLALIDSLALSPRDRVLLIRCDDREHLLLLGQQNVVVIEQHHAAPPLDQTADQVSDQGH